MHVLKFKLLKQPPGYAGYINILCANYSWEASTSQNWWGLGDIEEGSVLSKLDLKWGYHQIELGEESHGRATYITHKDTFRCKWLMFGITSLPGKCQQMLQDSSETANISEDIAIHGPSAAEHDKWLQKVLTRLKDRGRILNIEKCLQLSYAEAHFYRPSTVRSKHWSNWRKSQTNQWGWWIAMCQKIETFLGLVNINTKFISVVDPLRRL